VSDQHTSVSKRTRAVLEHAPVRGHQCTSGPRMTIFPNDHTGLAIACRPLGGVGSTVCQRNAKSVSTNWLPFGFSWGLSRGGPARLSSRRTRLHLLPAQQRLVLPSPVRGLPSTADEVAPDRVREIASPHDRQMHGDVAEAKNDIRRWSRGTVL
jgi:hypothetical protein